MQVACATPRGRLAMAQFCERCSGRGKAQAKEPCRPPVILPSTSGVRNCMLALSFPFPFPLVIQASSLDQTHASALPRQGSPTRLSPERCTTACDEGNCATLPGARRRPTPAATNGAGAGRRRSAAETGAAEDRGCRSLALGCCSGNLLGG